MRLLIHEIPDESGDLPGWLEQQVVGLHLGDLIDQLAVLFEDADQEVHQSLQSIWGDKFVRITQEGLSCLDQKELGYLLRHPQLLGELQDAIFQRGGDYWLSVPLSEEHLQMTKRSHAKFLSEFEREEEQQSVARESSGSAPPPSRSSIPVSRASKYDVVRVPEQLKEYGQSAWRRKVPMLVTAALILIAVGVWLFRPAATAGFAPASLLAADVSSTALLGSLADSAPDVERSSRSSLERQLVGFGKDCDRLQRARLPQLATADRDWLQERCAAWAEKLDGHLADLRSGTKSVEQIANEANATITALQAALRARAA